MDNDDNKVALRLLVDAEELLSLIVSRCENWASEALGANRANPVPFGQRQSIDSSRASVEVVDYIPEANDIVMEANSYNDKPTADERYIVVEFTYYCDLAPVDSCEYNGFRWKVVGSRGVVYDDFASGFPLEEEVFGGGSATVSRAFLVGVDESQFQLFFDYRGDNRVFFALE